MYAAMSSKDCCFGRTSSKSIGDTWPFCPKKPLLVGSMKLTLTIRAAFGNENPRSMMPFTTLNIVVTPQIPRARTMTASAQKPFSRRRTRRPTRRSWTRLVTMGVVREHHTIVPDFSFREFHQGLSKAGGDAAYLPRRIPARFRSRVARERDLQRGILRQGHGAVREHVKTSNRRHFRHMHGRWIRVRALLRSSYR